MRSQTESTVMNTDTATQATSMRLLGGELPTRPFVGPNLQENYDHQLRRIGKEGTLNGCPYLCRFADGHVEIMYFDYYYLNWSRVHLGFIQHCGYESHESWPFPVAFSSFLMQEGRLALHSATWTLPNERITADELPENTSMYDGTEFSLVVGRFRTVRSDGTIRFMLFPVTYTPTTKTWANQALKDGSRVPEGWCYPNDMVVASRGSVQNLVEVSRG